MPIHVIIPFICSHIRRRNPVRPSSRGGREEEDERLQQSYEGLWPKLRVIKDLFFAEDAREVLYATIKSTVRSFGRPIQLPMIPVKLYSDLQNPLLKKYRFDPDDFLEGAEIAVSNMMDVVDPAQISDERCAQLLSDITMGDVREGFLSWRSYVAEGRAKPVYPKVKGVFLTGVHTDIVTVEDGQVLRELFPSLGVAVAPAGAGPEGDKDVPDDNDGPLNPLKHYPVGSVVATVKVDAMLLKGDEEDTMVPLGPGNITEDYIVVMLTFSGCISGQKKLEWKVSNVIFSAPLVTLVDPLSADAPEADADASSAAASTADAGDSKESQGSGENGQEDKKQGADTAEGTPAAGEQKGSDGETAAKAEEKKETTSTTNKQ